MITTQIHKLQAQRGAPIGVAAFVFARGGGGSRIRRACHGLMLSASEI